MSVDPRFYWSIEDCGWRPGPGVDALATPWSGHAVGLPQIAPPVDGYAVLRSAPAPELPQQREMSEAPAEAPPLV